MSAPSHSNPFPGMNPFMEQRWSDTHLALVTYVREALGVELPEAYSAIGEQHVSVQDGHSSGYFPDVAIVDDSWKSGIPPVWTPPTDGPIHIGTVATPMIVRREIPKERWVEIRHDDGSLVTVIEVISPANRTSRRREYLSKRADYLSAGVNLVEIDLLRTGPRMLDMTDKEIKRAFGPIGESNFITATRSYDPARLEVYHCPLRDPLPTIRIPLRYPDPDVPLDIQSLINRCYETGRYWKLDYQTPLDPPLEAADAEWVTHRLTEAGLA